MKQKHRTRLVGALICTADALIRARRNIEDKGTVVNINGDRVTLERRQFADSTCYTLSWNVGRISHHTMKWSDTNDIALYGDAVPTFDEVLDAVDAMERLGASIKDDWDTKLDAMLERIYRLGEEMGDHSPF